MKKILHIITLSFLPNNTKVSIKCVSWIMFQVLTVGFFMEKISLEGWLWDVYYDVDEALRKKTK